MLNLSHYYDGLCVGVPILYLLIVFRRLINIVSHLYLRIGALPDDHVAAPAGAQGPELLRPLAPGEGEHDGLQLPLHWQQC